MVVVAYAGFRKSEWLQDASEFKKTNDFLQNIDGSVKAFIKGDFELCDSRNRRLYPDACGKIRDAYQVNIRWRFQKNGDNGQKVLYTRNTVDKRLCTVSEALRIYEHADRFSVKDDAPMAVYLHKGCKTFMTQLEVEAEMQSCAKKLYNLTLKEDITRYSAHSVRVGACVALHSTGASIMTIKFRLRWRSEKFVNYLRQIKKLAAQHNFSMNAVTT